MMTEKETITLELDQQIVQMLKDAAKEHETNVSEISNQLLHFAVDRLEAAAEEGFEFEDDEDDEDYDDEDEEFDDEDYDEEDEEEEY